DYGKILDQAEIEPSGVGSLESIEEYDPPKFVFMIPLNAEVDLGDYREIRKEFALEPFKVSEVDAYIHQLRRNAATIVPADHPAEKGDLVYFNLSGEFLNPAEDEDPTITDRTSQQVLIPLEGEESETQWPYPEFPQALIGVEPGTNKEIQFTYPKDYIDEDFRGKTALFTVEVQSVKELELPELDEDFVKSYGQFESVEDFRQKVEERLRQEHQESYDEAYFNEILNEITENANINYPPQMLAHEEEHTLEDIKSRIDNQHLDFDVYLKLRNTDETKFIEEEVKPVAKQRLERSLVMDALVKMEGLKLDQDMLKEQINDVMSEVVYSGNIEEMQKQMGKEAFSRAISMEGVSRTMNQQVFDRLKRIATGQPILEDEPESEEGLENVEEPVDEETLEPPCDEDIEITPHQEESATDVDPVEEIKSDSGQGDSMTDNDTTEGSASE
ncbi:MAG: trigger factor, partial [Anaerolineales bacterium]